MIADEAKAGIKVRTTLLGKMNPSGRFSAEILGRKKNATGEILYFYQANRTYCIVQHEDQTRGMYGLDEIEPA